MAGESSTIGTDAAAALAAQAAASTNQDRPAPSRQYSMLKTERIYPYVSLIIIRTYADIFSKEKIHALPEHSKYDHKIELEPGTMPLFGPIYPLSESELMVLKKYLDEMLATGKIVRSTSPAAAPILFVPKLDGMLRLCIDNRGLTKITIKNQYPLLLMNELQDRLGKARYFTKLDLKNGFYLLRIAKGDQWKTAFRCCYGLNEYTVMPFGLCNTPSTF